MTGLEDAVRGGPAAPDVAPSKVALSVVLPVYNEKDNLQPLQISLTRVLDALSRTYEILYVDDGSSDGTFAALSRIAQGDARVKVLRLRRNFGQTAALAAGIDHARGDVVITLDADLQNDPEDIPNLLARMDEGYDVVSGWRKDRHDPWLTRKLPSSLANKLIAWVTGVHINDYGCTLKAYRRELFQNVRIYGEMHRLLPAYLAWGGASVTEIPVRHHPRIHGKSKYGLSRTFKVLLDLMTIKFLSGYSTKPIYVFGTAGAVSIALGVMFGVYVLYQKFFEDVFAHRNPFLLLAVFLSLVGVQLILMGLLAEVSVRTYYESQGKTVYTIRQKLNLD